MVGQRDRRHGRTAGGRVTQPITPQRIFDSRVSKGGTGPFAAGDTRTIQVLGRGAVPLSGVAGIVGNLAVIPGTAGGYLTIWPAGRKMPTASNINFGVGGPAISNTFTVELGPTGAISVYDGYGTGAEVFIDVQAWIPAPELAPVGPSVLPTSTSAPSGTDSVKAAQVLTTALRYGMDTWWPGPAQTLLAADLGYDYLGKPTNHDAVRRLGMAALGMSTALATGLSTDPVMLARTVALVTRVAGAHVTNAVGGWGEGWQTSMWSSLCGRAAWLLWPSMPEETRAAVARMVAHEADYAARYQIHYLRDAAGTVLSPGDSGAEEVAWQGTAMQIAAVMLPTHPNAGIWQTEMQRFALAAWARPADVAGSPLTITGSNVEPNGQVINHSRIAPDYSTCIQFNLEAWPLFALAGKATPQAMRQFLGPVYAALNALYVPGTATITYPQGCDWGTGQQAPYALADALAVCCGFDTTGTAAGYLDLHLDEWLAQQARHADGHTYEPGEYVYEGCEEHAMMLAAAVWVALWMRDQGLGSFA
jgi:hypothetical protein